MILTVINIDSMNVEVRLNSTKNSSDVKHISNSNLNIYGKENAKDTIDFEWEGVDGCYLFCDGLYGSQTVDANVYKNGLFINKATIYPCDKVNQLEVKVCEDCYKELFDTLLVP